MSTSPTLRALTISGLLALGHAAQAQSPQGARLDKARAELQKRFTAADSNQDGRLSRDEARAGMPMVYKNFDAIDAGRNGAITLADIGSFMAAKKGTRPSGR